MAGKTREAFAGVGDDACVAASSADAAAGIHGCGAGDTRNDGERGGTCQQGAAKAEEVADDWHGVPRSVVYRYDHHAGDFLRGARHPVFARLVRKRYSPIWVQEAGRV
jgi:hypothetical protein